MRILVNNRIGSPAISALMRRCCCSCLTGLFLFGIVSSAARSQSTPSRLLLIPMPREIKAQGELPLRGAVKIHSSINKKDMFASQDLATTLHEHGIVRRTAGGSGITIELLHLDTPQARKVLLWEHLDFTAAMHDEGYILVSRGNIFYDIGATATGIFYGVQTIKQLILGQGRNAVLRKVVVRDWPAMRYRGQDDDVSRGPFPTLDYQKSQIRRFASYKLNIYSPYFENTLQYASTPLAAPPGGAMTREQVNELVRYAQQYHITIVPEQEAFGHLHHLLIYEKYANLAETPHGDVLAPGQPGSLQLISQWFAEVAQMFPGPFIHIGADETDDLGWGQTKQAVAKEGLARTYIKFLQQISASLQPLHKRLLFWGDVAMNSPELVKTLPKDMIAIAWQYSPPEGGFDKWITPFTDAGIETWVSPSANRGDRIYPDNDNNLKTIQGFVADGQRLGATGMLNTVWDDYEGGIFEQNWYGVLYGAAASWQPGTSSIPQFEESYGRVFHGDSSGDVNQAQMELIQAHLILAKVGLYAKNELFWEDPWSKTGQEDTAKILPVAHGMRLHAENAIVLIERARSQKNIRNVTALDAMELGARKFDFIGQKFQQAQEMLEEYNTMYAGQKDKSQHGHIMDLSYVITGNDGQCQDMRDGYGLIRDLFNAAWLMENRPYWLDNVLVRYEMNMQLWIHRGMVFRSATNEFDKTGILPSPYEVGIPILSNVTTNSTQAAQH
jgi:hexosaminidase